MVLYTTIWVLLELVFLFFVVLLLTRKRVVALKKNNQVQSIKLNLILKSLLLNLQVQRGLCSLRFNAIEGVSKELNQYIDENAELIRSAEYEYSHFLNRDPHWRTIRADWSVLKNNIFILDVETNVVSHNVLIENIIFMMGNIAHKGGLDLEHTLSEDEIRAIWWNIPQTLEALGRARAIGSGVATEGVCTRENKIKLIYLSDEIVKNYKYVSSQLSHFPAHEMQDMSSQIAQRIDNFLIVVHDKIITPEVPEVTADIFFNQATQTMDSVSQLFDSISYMKEKQINNAAV